MAKMSINRFNYLFIAVILCVLISTGSCLKCYNCVAKSSTDDCMNPREHKLEQQECVPEKIKNLANQVNQFAQNFGAAIGIDIDKQTKLVTNAFVCQKIETTLNDEKFLIRGCQVKDTGTDYCKGIEKQTSGTITHCSLCEEDGCNAGHWLAPLASLALLIPALAMFL